MRTIAHLSDIHFGCVDHATLVPLIRMLGDVAPDVVVVSGDLTQRARENQFEEAREFLDQLPKPQVVVPGNHDIPLYNVFARAFSPLHNYRKIISDDVEPCYQDDEIVIVGVNTARSATFKDGRINEKQVQRVRDILCRVPETVTKLVVTHHPLDLPRQLSDGETVGGAREAIESLARCGVDVFLAGHYHASHTGETTTRYAIPNFNALMVHAGTATSLRGRGEPNSFNIIRIDARSLVVECYRWRAAERVFQLFTSECFRSSDNGWSRVEPASAVSC